MVRRAAARAGAIARGKDLYLVTETGPVEHSEMTDPVLQTFHRWRNAAAEFLRGKGLADPRNIVVFAFHRE